MMFFFKPKVIHLDCFTTNGSAYELFPIDYSYKFYPDWWKKLPKKIETKQATKGFVLSMKNCVGLIEFYQNSITIPLWSDLLVKIDLQKHQHEVFFSDNDSSLGMHLPEQMQGLFDTNNHIHIKILSPWQFKCKEDIRFTWTQPTWNFNPIDQILIPPAIISYKYQTGTHINLFISTKNDKRDIFLDSGQPLVNISPMSERKIKIHNHLITPEEMDKIICINKQISFFGSYNKRRNILKNVESKCPFGFK